MERTKMRELLDSLGTGVPAEPAEPVQEQKPANEPAVTEVGGRNWKFVGAGAIAMVLAFVGLMTLGSTPNLGVAFMVVMALAGGGFLIWWGLRKKETGMFLTPGGKPKIGPANCLNIYTDKVEFEDMDITGFNYQPRKCRNDNKYYYVHIWGTAWNKGQEKLIPFMLPDTQYRDPREFANNLNIPAHRRLAQRRASLLEKISPLLLLAGMGIVALLFVVL